MYLLPVSQPVKCFNNKSINAYAYVKTKKRRQDCCSQAVDESQIHDRFLYDIFTAF